MKLPKRKPNRLANYDYSGNGAYFVTICSRDRKCLFCDIVGDGFPVPKRAGKIAEEMVHQIPQKYSGVCIEKYVVMPNHIHLLIVLADTGGTGNPSPTLGNIIGWYKYAVTRRINEEYGSPGEKVFQRSYHDHVIRGPLDFRKIWEYIDGNPAKWTEDCFYSK